jgi:hypothetical protein
MLVVFVLLLNLFDFSFEGSLGLLTIANIGVVGVVEKLGKR